MMLGDVLPDFLIVGAQKCGTTTLHYALGKHPEIFMSAPKELDFFEDDDNYARGIDWYASFFQRSRFGQVVGEASPEYFHYDHVPARIAKALPQVKIIVLFRNPVDRAYSGYWHSVRVARETLSFETAVQIERERIQASPHNMKFYSYTHRSEYARQLRPYLELLSASQLLVVISEEYFDDPHREMKRITEFLGVHCDVQLFGNVHGVVRNAGYTVRSATAQKLYPSVRRHFPNLARVLNRANRTGRGYPPLARSTRLVLQDRFSDDIEELEYLLSRDLTMWRAPDA